MSPRALYCIFSLAVVVVSATGSDRLQAQEQEVGPTKTTSSKKLNVQTYSVADILVPMMDNRSAPKSRKAAADHLIDLITTQVAKGTWESQGGQAVIRYFPNGMLLIIRQTDAVHEKIASALSDLRRRQARGEQQKEPDRLVHMVFPVADIVAPIQDNTIMHDKKMAPAPGPKEEALAETLETIIRTTIAKDRWDNVGGQGSIKYMSSARAFVVLQTQGTQEEVRGLLEQMRRAQNLQISFELRILDVPAAMAERIRTTMAKVGEPIRRVQDKQDSQHARFVLSGHGIKELLTMAAADKHATVRQAPKLTSYNGQKGCMIARHDQVGIRYDVQSVASADKRTVRVSLDFEYALPGKANGQPRRIRLGETFHVPDGGTFVWYAGELDGRQLFVTATPRIAVVEEEERVFTGSNNAIPR